MEKTTSSFPAVQSSAHRSSGTHKDILGIQTTSADFNSILPPQIVLTGRETSRDPQDKD